MNVNKAIILGNATRDPEIKTTTSGQTVASFGIATNRFWKDKQNGEKKEQVEFHNVSVWGRLAEIAQQYIKKGSLVYIEGRMHTHNWEDQNGNKKYRTEIIAERLQLGPKFEQSANKKSPEKKLEKNAPEPEINVEEIPF